MTQKTQQQRATARHNEKRRKTPRLPIVYTTADIMQKLDYLAEKYGSKKAAIEAAICEFYDKKTSGFTCQHCGETFKDFTPESEFIGWNGVCVKCAMKGIEV